MKRHPAAGELHATPIVAGAGASRLQIQDDIRYHRRSWRIQRLGWGVMMLVVAAALAGFLGHGPLSRSSTGHADSSVRLEYERFTRYQDPQTLRVHLSARATAAEYTRVSISREFLDDSKIEAIVPHPEAQEIAHGRVVYVFRVTERGAPTVVSFTLSAQRIGPVRGVIRLEGPAAAASEVRFWQWAYP